MRWEISLPWCTLLHRSWLNTDNWPNFGSQELLVQGQPSKVLAYSWILWVEPMGAHMGGAYGNLYGHLWVEPMGAYMGTNQGRAQKEKRPGEVGPKRSV